MVAVLKNFGMIFGAAFMAAALAGCNGGVPNVATQGAVVSGASQGLPAAAEPPPRKKAMMSTHLSVVNKENDAAALQPGARLGR